MCACAGANKYEFLFSLCHCIITRIIISNNIMQSHTQYMIRIKIDNWMKIVLECFFFQKNILFYTYFIEYFWIELCQFTHVNFTSDKICRLSMIINVIIILGIIAASLLQEMISDEMPSFIDVSTAIKTCLVSSTNSNKRARFVW